MLQHGSRAFRNSTDFGLQPSGSAAIRAPRTKGFLSVSEKIRTGIIRCDMHGMWFGAQMDELDPLRLREPMPVEDDMSYTWQRGGTHCFYYTKYSEPTLKTAPSVDGFQIVKVWDEQRRNAEMFSNVHFDGRRSGNNTNPLRGASEGVRIASTD